MPNFTHQSLQWDDLRLILCVARSGSFAGAAEQLGTSTPTIFRRAKALEERLGTLVFRRDNRGVSLTAAGRDAAAIAEQVEEEIGMLEARIGNENSEPAGTIRFATVDTLVAGPLMPMVARFRQAFPEIVLDLRAGMQMADLRQREVDAALRAGGEPPESLVGRRLCRIAVAVYRGQALSGVGTDDQERLPWVVPDDELGHLASARWLKARGHSARAALQVNSLHSLAMAVANGIGLGVLPCYLADGDPRLVRLGEPIEALASDLWFLTHSELRRTTRIRALSDHLVREIRALRPLFEGEMKHG
ncbi:LysR family transcriptional regulator [Sphingosinicella sp. CPCC 101087]|uniref:LysR family transcriptional regulator n=1 Tax=Sphingosinicella sp. CPCC 101087 TaxID=2497754 RepID=UPI00101D6926|nr:LysR family transcriptional regulator [Sphingosinicella sp. CPCC 101087]